MERRACVALPRPTGAAAGRLGQQRGLEPCLLLKVGTLQFECALAMLGGARFDEAVYATCPRCAALRRIMPRHLFLQQHRPAAGPPFALRNLLADKDARGIIEALDPVVEGFIVTRSASERALDASALAELVRTIAGPDRVRVEPNLSDAVHAARSTWQIGDAVVITGSITLVGDAITLAQEEGWA